MDFIWLLMKTQLRQNKSFMRQENLDLNKKYFNIIGYVKKNPF